MTFGYEDYQRTTHVAGNRLWYSASTSVPGGVVPGIQSPILDVGTYDKLVIFYDTRGLTGNYYVQIYWYDQYLSVGTVQTTEIGIGPNGNDFITIPVVGPKVYIDVNQATSVSDPAFKIYVWGSSSADSNIISTPGGAPPIWDNISVAAGVTETYYLNKTLRAQYTLHVSFTPNLKWHVVLAFRDTPSVGWQNVYAVNRNASIDHITETLFLPYTNIRIQITNDDTVAHTMYFFVMPAPF